MKLYFNENKDLIIDFEGATIIPKDVAQPIVDWAPGSEKISVIVTNAHFDLRAQSIREEYEEKVLLLMTAIETAQDALATFIPPESGVSEEQVIGQLLGILDDQNLVRKMREIKSNSFTSEKDKEIERLKEMLFREIPPNMSK